MSTHLEESCFVTKASASASCDTNQSLVTGDSQKDTDMLPYEIAIRFVGIYFYERKNMHCSTKTEDLGQFLT